jgi:hypothetical protein
VIRKICCHPWEKCSIIAFFFIDKKKLSTPHSSELESRIVQSFSTQALMWKWSVEYESVLGMVHNGFWIYLALPCFEECWGTEFVGTGVSFGGDY